jgi:hypothetical protein
VGAGTVAKVLLVIVLVFLAVSFVWYPAIYQDYLPSGVSTPILQARSELISLVGNLDSSLSDTNQNGPVVNSTWVEQFFAQVDVDRGAGGQLVPCTSLNGFAQYRFDDMTTGTNYEISHYNYQNDLQSYFKGQSGTFEEEYFFPDGYTPSAYLGVIQQKAPIHWMGLLNATYTSYGYTLSKGPVIEYATYLGSTCNAPSEVVGEGVNMTQVGSGCRVTVVQGTWFVIEMGSVCP